MLSICSRAPLASHEYFKLVVSPPIVTKPENLHQNLVSLLKDYKKSHANDAGYPKRVVGAMLEPSIIATPAGPAYYFCLDFNY